jgi:hypothetical protein
MFRFQRAAEINRSGASRLSWFESGRSRKASLGTAGGKGYEIRPTCTCTAKLFELVPTAGKEAALAASVPVRVCPQP